MTRALVARKPMLDAELRTRFEPDRVPNSADGPAAEISDLLRMARKALILAGFSMDDPRIRVCKPRRAKCVEWTVLDNETVLFNTASGDCFTLNTMGTILWQSLTGQSHLDEILAVFMDRFNVPADVLERDMKHLLSTLVAEGLVDL